MVKRVVISLCIAVFLLNISFDWNRTTVANAQAPDQNCIVTPFELYGQGFSVIAGVGSAFSDGQPVDPASFVDVSWLPTELARIGDVSKSKRSVKLMIVDDFSRPDSHGAFVQAVTNKLLNALPDQVRKNITVESVDIGAGYNNFPEYGNLRTAKLVKDRVKDLTPNPQHIVVNLSFALIPCLSGIDDFYKRAASDAQVSLVKERGAEIKDRLAQFTPTQLDPLREWMSGLLATRRGNAQTGQVLFVGSAGNSADLPALYPAAWQEVIAVGGTSFVQQGKPSPWPNWNRGEVAVPGRIYSVDISGQTYYLSGTSFAAPGVSVLMAAYLSMYPGGSKCRFVDLPTLDRAQRPFDNQSFESLASAARC
jgi:hypothetical protein